MQALIELPVVQEASAEESGANTDRQQLVYRLVTTCAFIRMHSWSYIMSLVMFSLWAHR